MKLFGIDVFTKYIRLKIDGKEYTVQFKDSLVKGVHNVKVFSDRGEEAKIEILNIYPPLKVWFPEVWRIWFPCWVKRNVIKVFRQSHSR